MIEDYDTKRKASIEAKRKELDEEEKHFARLRKVFGTPEGTDIFIWLLDLLHYWTERIDSDRHMGRFELGRYLFNQMCLADMATVNEVLARRSKAAESMRIEERRALDLQEKGRL